MVERRLTDEKAYHVRWPEVYDRLTAIMDRHPRARFYGIPRGGAVVAGLTMNACEQPEDADVIVDDIRDSGRTAERFRHWGKPIEFLFDKLGTDDSRWLVMPWEHEPDRDLEDHVARLLEGLGENVRREGLRRTPERVVRFYREFLSPPEFELTVFDAEDADEMIVQSNIPFSSLCEHHMAPFTGTGTIAYIPNGKIVGLSKLARTLDRFSRRLQNQERLTTQVADYLSEHLNPKGVAVLLRARHSCMELRGIKVHDTWTTTSCLRGYFKDDHRTREEFMRLATA